MKLTMDKVKYAGSMSFKHFKNCSVVSPSS